MFKRYKVLTKYYMQNYKTKRDEIVPRLEKKIRRILIRNINKEIKIAIKYGRTDVFLDLSKKITLGYSLAEKVDIVYYREILQGVISEYEGEGIKVNKRLYLDWYNFHLEGVFDNDN